MRCLVLVGLVLASLSCGGDDDLTAPPVPYSIDFVITGRVASAVNGRSLGGSRVSAVEWRGWGMGDTIVVTHADADGRYTLGFSRTYRNVNCGWGTWDYPDEGRFPGDFYIFADPPQGDTVHTRGAMGPAVRDAPVTVTCASGTHTLDFRLRRREY